MGKRRIGIVGCGVIGSEIARACMTRLASRVELVALCDSDAGKANALCAASAGKPAVVALPAALPISDLLIEAANGPTAAEVLTLCVAQRKDCMIMSVGGLLAKTDLLDAAAAAGITVSIPSGAIAGIDGLKSARVGTIEAVTITTRKPPAGLRGAPYLVARQMDLSGLTEDTVVFEGNALEAVKAFPANINVAAVLSLAGIGPERTRVRIIASPSSDRNIHEIEIVGEAGTVRTRTENVPSRGNPKTSALAICSAIATLEGIVSSVRIGT